MCCFQIMSIIIKVYCEAFQFYSHAQMVNNFGYGCCDDGDNENMVDEDDRDGWNSAKFT